MNAAIVNSWENKNRNLFFQFPEEWVAFAPDLGIIEHNADLDLLIDTLKAKELTFKDFAMKFVHQSEIPVKPVRFVPVRLYGIRKKEWTPDYLIGLKVEQIELNESMLYVSRKITFIIDGIEVEAPVAWLQGEKYNELIIGREVIFDAFDIEFK